VILSKEMPLVYKIMTATLAEVPRQLHTLKVILKVMGRSQPASWKGFLAALGMTVF